MRAADPRTQLSLILPGVQLGLRPLPSLFCIKLAGAPEAWGRLRSLTPAGFQGSSCVLIPKTWSVQLCRASPSFLSPTFGPGSPEEKGQCRKNDCDHFAMLVFPTCIGQSKAASLSVKRPLGRAAESGAAHVSYWHPHCHALRCS